MRMKYESGEEPRIGDVVRLIETYKVPAWPVSLPGTVFVVTQVTAYTNPNVVFIDATCLKGANARRFTLIARAGERVKYLPGDVVECIKSGVHKGNRCGAGEPGERFTVSRACLFQLDFVGQTLMANDANRFKLVFRPDPAVRGVTYETLVARQNADDKVEAFREANRKLRVDEIPLQFAGLKLRSVTPRAEGENVAVTLLYGPKRLAEQRIVVGSRVMRKYYRTKGVVKQLFGVDTPRGPVPYAVVQFNGADNYSQPLRLEEFELTDDYPFTTEEN